ncbi:MAG TPA: ATP-binding protein, partial [Opitutaceae bacterium]
FKFARSDVPLRIDIWAEDVDGGRVRLYVADNGIGIAPEHFDRIWKIFERVDYAIDGTGIGLSIVRKAIERMNGAVGVQSEAGKGSTFWIELDKATT